LNTRAHKNRLDGSFGWNKCQQPWVLRSKSEKDYKIYAKAWKVLTENLGYPPPQLHTYDPGNPAKSKGAISKSRDVLTTPPSDSSAVEEYESPMHNTIINLLRFQAFIKEHCEKKI
jgi:hypothetical protein